MEFNQLKAYIQQQIATGTVTLSSTDARVGPTLQDFLKTAPATTWTITNPVPGLSPHGDYSLSGTLQADWPIQGILGQAVKMVRIRIYLSPDQTGNSLTAVVSGDGTITLGNVQARVMVQGGTAEKGRWRLTNPAPISGISPITLLSFPQLGPLPFPIPESAGFLRDVFTVAPSQFSIDFYPQTEDDADYQFLQDAPSVSWKPVPGVFELTGFQFGAQWFGTGLSFRLITDFLIGTVGVKLIIMVSDSPDWTVNILPADGKKFPGLAALAKLLGGETLEQNITEGVTTLGLGDGGFDAAISNIVFTFNWKELTLTSFKVISTLSLKGIDYNVAFAYPSQVITGWLDPTTPVKIYDVLRSFGLPNTGVPETLLLTQFSISIDFKQRAYSLSTIVSDETGWQLGPLALNTIAFNIAYDGRGFSGSINARVTISGVSIYLIAGYDDVRGWYFEGGTSEGSQIPIGTLIAELGTKFNARVPDSIANMTLDGLDFAYETKTGNFHFGLEVHLQIQEVPVKLIPSIKIENIGTPEAPRYRDTYAGIIDIGSLEFLLLFNTEDNTDLFLATYSHTDEQEAVNLYDLVQSISPGLAQIIPTSLSIDLKDVIFAYYNIQSGNVSTKKWTIAMDLSATFDLSNIPLTGQVMPANQRVGFQNLKIQYSNNAFTDVESGRINTLLMTYMPNAQPLQPEGFPSGANAVAVLQFGNTTSALGLDLTGNATQGPQPMPSGPAPAQQQFSNALWYPLQRAIGPIYFDRVGVDYTNGRLFFLLDASFEVAGLKLSLQGAGFGSPLTTFDLKFRLSGIGIEYSAPGIDIGGGLLIVDPPTTPGVSFQFDGSVIIQVGELGIAAFGSYAQFVNGEPSLFVYANINLPIGPIPAFFITGIGVGFGYNRDVLIPPIDEVLDFPLIAVANQNPAMPTSREDVLAILEGRKPGPSGKTRIWIAPKLGEYWLAFGLQFTTYELIQSNAVVVAKFGVDLELALIGISKMQLPQTGDNPYVYVELMLEADWKPDAGFFGISAQLSRNSFVLDPNCHLMGGFAFYVWYSGDNAGQFVVTLGGYHPQFTVPSYYPRVPRVGISWQISDLLSITGNAYFALTPSAVMAGGNLALNFHDGNLKAWFVAQADALITFKPFYFQVTISVSIGISFRLNLLFTTATISVSLGAGLTLYGPPVGGSVYIDFYLFGFTIKFGPDPQSVNSTPQTWAEIKSLLPEGKENTIAISTGLKSKLADETPVVRANEFAFTTNTVIPAQQLTYNDSHDIHNGAFEVNIRPLNARSVASKHNVQIQREGDPSPMDLADWTPTPLLRAVPAALWGAPLQNSNGGFILNPSVPTADTVTNAPSGISLRAPAPRQGATPGPLEVQKLSTEPILPNGKLPLVATPSTVSVFQPAAATDTVAQIALINGAVQTKRGAVYETLKAAGLFSGPNGPLSQYAAYAGELFTDVPLKI